MNPKKLRKHFGAHHVPPLLDEMVAFSRKKQDFFSGEFELSDFDGEDVAEVVVGNYAEGVSRYGAEIRKQLALFGSDADGSQYGLWFRDKKSATSAPVVYLNSEGSEDTNVIAANLAEFVSLLLLDVSDLGMFYSEPRDEDDAHAEQHEAFVKWAKGHGITVAKSPKKLVAAARKAHPGFGKWLRKIRDELDQLEPEAAGDSGDDASQFFMRWLKLGKSPPGVEVAAHTVVTAVRKELPGLQIDCRMRTGSTSTVTCDFPKSGTFPADFAKASELRVEFMRGDDQQVCIVLEPPAKSESKQFEVTLWLADQPEKEAAFAAILKVFEGAFARGK